MRKQESFVKQNNGSALIAVLIILTFVSIVALIITKITITNIEMKEVQSSTRKNFYNTEDIMDKMKSGLSKISAEAIKEAYQDVLGNYSLYVSDGKNIENEFQNKYLEKIEDKFWDDSEAKNTSRDDLDTEKKLYTIAKYKVDVVKDCIVQKPKDGSEISSELNARRESLKTTASEALYELDYKQGIFTLKNIKVAHEEKTGYSTEITTDIVFEAPKMMFDKEFQMAAFMKYALIADNMIDVNAANVDISGNVYAGVGGIKGSNSGSSGSFDGDTIITRGDILADNGASLGFNSGSTSDSGIWTQNIKTKGADAKLSISGNSYVADDLSIDGKGSTVTLSGGFFGYNFQKNYGENEIDSRNNALYNSSIIINGKDSTLDMKSLNNLMICGRTFISRGGDSTVNSDIAMGESLAVRTNQLAYYVPEKYLALPYDSSEPAKQFTEDGIKEYEKVIRINNESDDNSAAKTLSYYLDDNKQVVPYYYVDEAIGYDKPFVNYYLNFKSQQKANEFFAEYYNANKMAVNARGSVYASKNALIVNKNKVMTLGGNILYREKESDELNQKTAVSLDTTDWDKDGAYFENSASLAMKYKALQLGLTTTHKDVSEENVRISLNNNKDAQEDKTQNSLFEYMVDKNKLKETVDGKGASGVFISKDEQIEGTLQHRVVILADNSTKGVYNIPTEYTQGIVIATGDVYISGSFKGLVLSGGTISFASNATVMADEKLVSDLFQADMKNVVFTDVINADTYLNTNSLGGLEVKDYISYDNWKKN